jgi:hypothetical protein
MYALEKCLKYIWQDHAFEFRHHVRTRVRQGKLPKVRASALSLLVMELAVFSGAIVSVTTFVSYHQNFQFGIGNLASN